MSENINQIFISNPASSMQNNDLFYLGRSPYGLTNDMAILWSNVLISLAGSFLEKANNLSDLANQTTAYQNFGMGARSQITYTDSDFPVVLTNPCPNIITLNCSSPGNVLQLPDAQGVQSFELFNGPEIINLGTERVDIISFLGISQTPSQPSSDFDYLLTDKSTTGGLWDARGHINTINGTTGNVVFTSNDGSVTITPDTTTQQVNLSVLGSEGIVYQQLYVNDASGNDSNSGSILQPMKTYEAARLKAVSLSASINNLFVINIIGVFSITGNMTITPFVSVIGTNNYSSRISLTGNIALDSAWNTTTSPFALVGNINFVGSGGINLTYTTFKSGSFIRFENCSIQLGNAVLIGSGTNTECERIIFNNCTTDGFGEPTFTATNVNLSLFNTNPSNNITVSVTSSTSLATFVLTGAQTRTGNITLNATAAGTLTTILGSSNTYGKTLTINGSSNTVNIDSTSYQFTLALTGGATLSNTNIPSMGEGVNVNTNFTPTAYTPIAGSLYKSSSLIGNLAGINNALTAIGTNLSQLIFVNAAIGNDSNDGNINRPMATYDAARLLAISRGASASNPINILIVGALSITGTVTISPFICVQGLNTWADTISATGNLILDTSWGTKSDPFCFIGKIGLYVNSINFVYSAHQQQSIIKIQDCFMGMSTTTIVGSGGGGAAVGDTETVVFENCSNDIPGYADPSYTITNANVSFLNTGINAGVTCTVSSSTTKATMYIQNIQQSTGNITLNATAAGTLKTHIGASNTSGKTLTINGTSNTVYVDSTSYQFGSLSFSGSATLSNLIIESLSDGIINTSYSPSNYTPVAGTSYASNTLTANLRGIDNALASDLQWKVITTSQTMVSGQGYITNSASLITLTIPSSIAAGQVFGVAGLGSGGWSIAQASGQSVSLVNNTSTTTGTGGSLSSDSAFPRSSGMLVADSTTNLVLINVNGLIDAV